MNFKTKNQILNLDQSHIVFWGLISLLVLSFIIYSYLLLSSIINVVDRQTVEKSITELDSKVLTLESEYVRVKNSITFDPTNNHGFIALTETKYLDQTPKADNVAVNLR